MNILGYLIFRQTLKWLLEIVKGQGLFWSTAMFPVYLALSFELWVPSCSQSWSLLKTNIHQYLSHDWKVIIAFPRVLNTPKLIINSGPEREIQFNSREVCRQVCLGKLPVAIIRCHMWHFGPDQIHGLDTWLSLRFLSR